MDYFLNGILSTENTAIEQNMLRRLALFPQLDRSAKIVLCAYSANSAAYVQQQQLSSQVISCFDWLQEAADYRGKALRRDDLTLLDNYQRSNVKDGYLYLAGTHLLARGQVNRHGEITRVTYYDAAEKQLEIDQYDSRGFLSRQQFFDEQQRLVGVHYLNPAGQLCLAVSYVEKKPVLYRLVRRQQLFTSQKDLLQYCLSQLLPAAEVVVAERREYDSLLAAIECQLRVVRLYNAAYQGDEAVADLFLARRSAQLTNEKTILLDEYAQHTDLKAQWQQIITKNIN
ncbi:hypothetical protein [Loigolactobacillus zhaoyuanensis]|uniref:Uncharacterized protein n=1 Tax=Loigolactobacillus zhaoyuanensis TaxID=2486017 RepID=A0ABW8UE73_9LACO|nr:hypothetical protein [Loigolactobacillus zhaoyuanensis]